MAKAKKKSNPAKKASAKKSASKAQSKSKALTKSKVASKSKVAAKNVKATSKTSSKASSSNDSMFIAAPRAPTGPVGISPVRSRVIVRRDESEERTAGGLYIPDTAKDKPLMGRVVAVGSGSINKKGVVKPLEVKVGDHVVFSRYTGSQIKVDGQDLMVIEEKEIIGIMQD